MALESVVDLAQFRPEVLPLPGAPVLARRPAADRESRGGAGVRLAALAIFTAGMASTVAFSTRPPASAAAAPLAAPVFAVRTPAPAAAPALQSLAGTPAGGEVRSSPTPFYGGTDRIAAVGADAALASGASQPETGKLVPFFNPARAQWAHSELEQAPEAQPIRAQAQSKAPTAKTFQAPRLRSMPNFAKFALAQGWSAGALHSSVARTSMFVGGPCRNARPACNSCP